MRPCEYCGTAFGRKSLIKHLRAIHGVVTYKCTCQREFLKEESKQQHLKDSKKHYKHKDTHPVHEQDVYKTSGRDIGTFIRENVQAGSQDLECCGVIIDYLVTRLKAKNGPKRIQPREIIKSGSFGKGTAVKGRSDIDLVLMLAYYTDVEDLMKDMPYVLRILEKYLVYNTKAKHQKTTRFSVQVEIKCRSGHMHDVDVLPAVDLIGLEYSHERIYQMMKEAAENTDMIHEYSVSLAPTQRDIIRQLPTEVKDLIKMMKYWKNQKLKVAGEREIPSFASRQDGDPKWPSSYVLELVVMAAWEEAGEPEHFDMVKALHAVLTMLVNHKNMQITFPGKMKYLEDMIKQRSPPYIMDPANPYNDMYHGLVNGEAFDWDRVVPEAKRWLDQQLFAVVKDADTHDNWE